VLIDFQSSLPTDLAV